MDCLHNFISCVELICRKPLGLFSSGFILDRYGLWPSEKSAQRVKIKLNTWKQSQNWLESLLNVKCIAGSYLSFYDMIERKKNQCQTQLISAEFSRGAAKAALTLSKIKPLANSMIVSNGVISLRC